MAKKRLHNEWIQLLEISGPFFSHNVLHEAFPQGLLRLDSTPIKACLRQAYAQWESQKTDPSVHTAWLELILKEMLAYATYPGLLLEQSEIPESLRLRLPGHSRSVAPDYLLRNPAEFEGTERHLPRLLIQTYPPTQMLHKPLPESPHSPQEQLTELCRTSGVPLGLVSNGEDWVLIHAPVGETSTYVQWQAALWVDEPLTFKAFLNLLCLERFMGQGEDTLEKLFARSLSDQFELTDQLGKQVREAVEILVHTFDRLDSDQGLLKDLPEHEIYEGALTVMMRLVLMFCAEERDLFPMQNPHYRDHYSLSQLGAQLRESADKKTEDVLQYHTNAWSRLLATFRMVYAGCQHDLLKIPAYGSSLFDPDRFPFLEGRQPQSQWQENAAEPLAVDNRTVLHLLEALQVLRFEGETRRVSFRALDPEQIGYIYEGLLDHTAVRAPEAMLGLKGSKSKNQDHEPEILLSDLEAALAKGQDDLFALIQKESKRSLSTLQKEWAAPYEDEQRLQIACYNQPELLARVKPFANFLREDSFRLPFVVNTGGVVVTQGQARASSGTHYTPRFLCEEVVKHSLDPLVYLGPSEGLAQSQWQLKPAEELLNLKICDLAMGSGAFLVQACRYLSEKLVEAWQDSADTPNQAPSQMRPQTLPYGTPSTGSAHEALIPADPNERLMQARRLVVMRCLYGVDKNPMAVEMAKLSLWLITLAKDQPFGFLDHHLRCGDSLLGLTQVAQLQYFHLDPTQGRSLHKYVGGIQSLLKSKIKESLSQRQALIEDELAPRQKEALQHKIDQDLAELRLYADLIVGTGLSFGKKAKAQNEKLQELAHQIESIGKERKAKNREMALDDLQTSATALLGKEPGSADPRKPFHWLLEFPEVFASAQSLEQNPELANSPLFQSVEPKQVEKIGFDAIVGNPPFLGGKKITDPFGSDYREYLLKEIGKGVRGNADLCAYFYLRAAQIAQSQGCFGLISTNTIAQGDTREVGLDQLLANNASIYRALPSMKWPGQANLEVALVWLSKQPWQGVFNLQEQQVDGITAYLTPPGKAIGKPHKLVSNSNMSFIGSYVLGMGFTLTPEEAQNWIDKDPKNKDVLFPYINGQELNTHPNQEPSRWVINFFDWPLDRATAPDGYDGPVAADYPEMLKIVEDKVKPERTRLKPNGEYALRKPLPQKWWIYADKRPKLYKSISGLQYVLARSRVSNTHSICFIPATLIASDATVVFPFSEHSWFTLLQSNFHDVWLVQNASSMRNDIRYTPSDCFETFPFPPAEALPALEDIGETYDQHRQAIMQASQLGLTKTYNRFHDPKEHDPEIVTLRTLHGQMDQAVAAAYGWQDLKLDHGFHETKQGLRYTVSEAARLEILDRLLALNHARYAEEVRQGLHAKKKKK